VWHYAALEDPRGEGAVSHAHTAVRVELGPLRGILERFGVAVGDALAALVEDVFRARWLVSLAVPHTSGPVRRFPLLLKRSQLRENRRSGMRQLEP